MNEGNIPITIPYIVEHLGLFPDYDVELILVCDGSPDGSYEAMQSMKKQYPDLIRIARLTRNFGQGAAIHCGVDLSRGDVIGVISCDMQDPFELFVDMIHSWEQGKKLVIATRESHPKGLSAITSRAFHRLAHSFVDERYPIGGFDFFLMDREVADGYCKLDVYGGSMQMSLLWLGYDYEVFRYKRRERTVGHSGYSFKKKANAAISLFISYSTLFSRCWLVLGLVLILVSVVALIASLVTSLAGFSISSIAYLAWLLLLCTGLTLCALACNSEYVWRVFLSTSNRPRYVIAERE